MALSPKGACVIALRWFIRGRAVGLWEFIQGFEGRTPLAKLKLGPLPQGGVRLFATLVADPLAKLKLGPLPQGACGWATRVYSKI